MLSWILEIKKRNGRDRSKSQLLMMDTLGKFILTPTLDISKIYFVGSSINDICDKHIHHELMNLKSKFCLYLETERV